MSEEHSSPIKNWKQLLVVVSLAFLVPIILIIAITQLVTSHLRGTPPDDSAVLTRIKPVGEVVIAEVDKMAGQRTGEQVFGMVCKNCHEAGLAGAPKFGDKTAWGRIVAQGEKLSVEHAITGIRAMPPKGGNPDLTEDEVHRAVVYMANAGGANWTAPAVAATVTAANGERSGQQVVEAVCVRCHGSGAGGAPRIGDQAAWRTRAARGFQSVAQSALRGHAGMPARGGMAELSDVEVKRAIEYMMYAGGTAAAGAAAAPAASATARVRCRQTAGRSDDGVNCREARWQEGLRHDLHGLPRHRGGGRAEVRRQGRLGTAHQAGDRIRSTTAP